MTFWPLNGKAVVHSLPPVEKEPMVITQEEMDRVVKPEEVILNAPMIEPRENGIIEMIRARQALKRKNI